MLTAPLDDSSYKSTTVFLVDGSESTVSLTSGQERNDYASMLEPYFPHSGNSLVLVGVFGGKVDWRLAKVTPGISSDALRTKYDLDDAQTCFAEDLASAAETPPDMAGTDVLRVLTEAGDQVGGISGPVQIDIATDGLTNTGCADLRGAPIGDYSAIPDIVKSCRAELPQFGKNIEVRMLGLGHPADGWPDVNTPALNWLKSLWTQLCTATGANCLPPDLAIPQTVPVSGAEKYPVDPAVPIPNIQVTHSDPAIITVPASILFSTDSAQLSPQAQATIDQVVTYINQFRYTTIKVRGYTDIRGTPEHNLALSLRRAQAVLAALKEKGINNLTAQGLGENDPRCTPQYENGAPNLIAMACDRRVEISIYY